MMSEQQFDLKLRHIEDQAAGLQKKADYHQEKVHGYRDQEMARLFVESGWSQEQLAAHLARKWRKEVSPDWVAKRLRFGRFLTFFNTGRIETHSLGTHFKLPRTFTEWAFRGYWEETEASDNFSGRRANTTAAIEDEQRRFAEIVQVLHERGVLVRLRKQIREAIVEAIGGKPGWLTVEQIAEKLNPLPTGDSQPGAVLVGELNRALEDKDYRASEFETPPTYYKKAVKAWNAFCAGQRVSSLKVTRARGWPEVARYGDQENAA